MKRFNSYQIATMSGLNRVKGSAGMAYRIS